jgi:hypothetical protein
MLILVVPLFLQVALADPQEAQGPSTPPAAESGQAKPAEPEAACTIKPVTGSRVKKMRVCKTKDYEKNSERARDTFDQQQRMGGGTAPPGAPG